MKKYKFNAKIEAGDGGGAYVLFPYDTGKAFATKGNGPVEATFNGVPYTGSLIKYGNPLHMLGMLKAIREQTGKGPGDTVEVVCASRTSSQQSVSVVNQKFRSVHSSTEKMFPTPSPDKKQHASGLVQTAPELNPLL